MELSGSCLLSFLLHWSPVEVVALSHDMLVLRSCRFNHHDWLLHLGIQVMTMPHMRGQVEGLEGAGELITGPFLVFSSFFVAIEALFGSATFC